MALATLSIDIEAKLAKLTEGMDQASRVVAKNAAQIQGSLDRLKVASAAIGGLIGGVFAGIGTAGFARAFLQINAGVDALNDFKDATGSSIENASALEDAARRTGTSFETAQNAVLRLNKVLAEAKPDSAQAAALKAIGLSAEELRRLDPAEALLKVSLALREYEDDGNKARLMQALLGRSVAEIAPLLNDLADKGRLVATVTAEQAEEASKFAKQLSDLEKTTLDAARALSGPMVAAINETIKRFRDGAAAGKGFFSTLRDEQLKLLGLGGQAGDELAQYGRRIGELQEILGKEARPLVRSVAERELNDLLAKRAEILQKIQTSTAGAGRGSINPALVRPSVGDVPDPTKPDPTKRVTAPIPEIDKLIERLKAAQIATFDLTEEQKINIGINTGAISGSERKLDQLRQEARLLDQLRAKAPEAQPFGPDIDPAELQRRSAAQADLKSLLDQSLLGQTAQQAALQDTLNEAYREGTITLAQYQSASFELEGRLGTLSEKAQETLSELDEFTAQAARNLQDQLGATVADALQGDFDSIEDGWKGMLANMAAQAIAANLNRALFGADYGKTGQLGGLLGDLIRLSGDGAGANYGNEGRNYPAPVGVEPSAIASRATAQRAGNSVTIHQQVSVGQGVSRGEVTAAVADGNRALVAQLQATGRL